MPYFPPSSSGGSTDTTKLPVTSPAGNLTISNTATYVIILVDTSAARTITLPAPATVGSGRRFIIVDAIGSAETNNITIARNASETIDGVAASKIFSTGWGSIEIVTDGTNWFTV